MRNLKLPALIVLFSGLVGSVVSADEPPKAADPGTLILIDNAGKEHKLKAWKFTTGTRRLSWLAPAGTVSPKKQGEKDKPEADKPVPETGPEALEFRDEHSTNFVKGIVTLVPLERIRAIDYDNDAQTVSVRVATGETDQVLTGSSKFQGINKLVIEAEVDKGDLGVAELKFQGGVPKGIRGVRFGPPKMPAKAHVQLGGRPAKITASGKEKSDHQAADVQPLYRLADGSLRTLPTLMFKKTLKIDLAKVKKLHLSGNGDKEGIECGLTLKDGEESTLTLLKAPAIEDKTAVLEGLVGRVAAGYKLFPLHTIAELVFEESKRE